MKAWLLKKCLCITISVKNNLRYFGLGIRHNLKYNYWVT